jgi:hypothetical protein
VVLRIDTYATRKNDISLFPFVTNSGGVAHISKEDMEAEISAMARKEFILTFALVGRA